MSAFLLINARIYARAIPAPEAMVIEDGRIAWLGSNVQAASFSDLATLDCGGHWLAPAFTDAHVHITNTGIELLSLSLKSVQSAEELGAVVSQSAASAVLIGHGWDDTDWQRRPSRADIASTTPTYVSRVDVHSALINDALIQRCSGIEKLDGWDESGRVTRAAHGFARSMAYSLLTDADRAAAQNAFFDLARSQAIVAVDEMAGPVVSSLIDAAEVKAAGTSSANPDVYVWWGELFGLQNAANVGAYGCGGDLFVDGSLGSCTAHVSEPYPDGTFGATYISEADVAQHIRECVGAGMPTGFHAIGDAALNSVVDGFSTVADEKSPAVLAAGRHRIEHAEMLSDEHRQNCARLGISLSMQPQFDELWAQPGGMYEQRLGNRADVMNDFAAAAAEGVALLLGSDAPVTELNPWRTIAAATTTHHADHALSMRAAFAASTRAFWRNHGVEDCGTIEVGAVASIALWKVPAFLEQRVDPTIKRWSTDPRSGTQPLPDLSAGFPECLKVWKRGALMFERDLV